MMESFIEYLRDFIEDELDNFEGQKFDDGYSLADTLTESINVDGSATYSTRDAEEYLKEWWNDCGEFYEDYTNNFGTPPANPFQNPEAFQVQMIIIGVERMLSQCELGQPFTLTKTKIKKIIAEIQNVTSVF